MDTNRMVKVYIDPSFINPYKTDSTYILPETKTKEDAYMRVTKARIGSLADKPTYEYLITLRKQVYGWIEDIDKEILKHDTSDPM